MVSNLKNNKGVLKLAKIIVKNDILEMMIYIWDSIAQRQKIVESFIIEVTEQDCMKYLYGEDFNKESVRKVLSAISNREVLNRPTKKESRFWSNNMWMLEDINFTNSMIAPVKQLNLNHIAAKINKDIELEVIFVPGHIDEYYIDGNKLIINFFKIIKDPVDAKKITIAEKPFMDYLEEKILELVDKTSK